MGPQTYHVITTDGVSTFRTARLFNIINTYTRLKERHEPWHVVDETGRVIAQRKEVP